MKAQVAERDLLATVHATALRRAAQLLGSELKLALRLNVTPSHLALWMKDVAPIPADVFLNAVDIIAEQEFLHGSNDQPDLNESKPLNEAKPG
jgi:hypothetical protein